MATKAQKTKVGIFLLVGFGLIAGGIAFMMGATTEPYTTYYLVFNDSVLGLGAGGLVEYLGVPVGSVQNIYVDTDGKAKVEIRVDNQKVTLREGVVASLSTLSLAAGTMAVHLEGGDPSSPPLPEGTLIPAESSFLVGFTKAFQSSIGQLEGVLTSVGEAAEQLSESLNGMEEGALSGLLAEATGLASDSRKFLASTESTMTDLKQTVQTALEAYTDVAKDIEWVADDVGKTAESAKELIEDVQAKLAPVDLAKAQADLETALTEFASLAENLNATLSRVDGAAESVTHDIDNMEYSLRETLNSATEALNVISATVSEIQENPSSIIRGRGKPKAPTTKEPQ